MVGIQFEMHTARSERGGEGRSCSSTFSRGFRIPRDFRQEFDGGGQWRRVLCKAVEGSLQEGTEDSGQGAPRPRTH